MKLTSSGSDSEPYSTLYADKSDNYVFMEYFSAFALSFDPCFLIFKPEELETAI